jgi:hypothetical protein
MLGGRKITATLAGETLEESVARGYMQGGVLLPPLWSLLWMNSYEDSMRMAVIHWDMQMILLSSSAENSQTPSQSFYRRL